MRYITSVIATAAILPLFAVHFESQLNLAGRLADGSILQDVTRVQTYNGEARQNRIEKNMRAIRQHVVCVEEYNGVPGASCRSI